MNTSYPTSSKPRCRGEALDKANKRLVKEGNSTSENKKVKQPRCLLTKEGIKKKKEEMNKWNIILEWNVAVKMNKLQITRISRPAEMNLTTTVASSKQKSSRLQDYSQST